MVYLLMIRKRNNLPYLRHNTTYLRLIHSLLTSAPLIVLYLYTLFLHLPTCLEPAGTEIECSIANSPAIWVGLGASLVSFLYSILAFTSNDRLSGKRRRVILPAHVTQILWYVCVLTSRILAMVLFAYAHQYYIFPFIGGHWILMFVFLLAQRTTFCADVIRENPTEVRIKRRWYLEIPFLFVAATMYIFTYFNFRRGNTRFWMLFFHLLMYAEIATMSALFYITYMTGQYYVFSLTALTLSLGLYPVGILFMLTYYLFFHPEKTEDWYWIGIPKWRDRNVDSRGDIIGTGFRNRMSNGDGRVVISGPTLVAHNGFIPQSMLPDGIPTSPSHESRMVTGPEMIISQSRTNVENKNRLVEDWVTPRTSGATTHRDLVTSLTMVSPNSTVNTAILPATTPTDSLPALSDLQSQIGPSDMDTENDSRLSPRLIGGDTVIDTPLFGTTPDPVQQLRIKKNSAGEPMSLGTLRSQTDTVDTGIDLEADKINGDHDHGVSSQHNPVKQNGGSGSSIDHEDMSLGIDIDLAQFKDIPAKRQGYLGKKSSLESHYFPEKNGKESRESLTPTLPTPTWGLTDTPPYHSPGSNRAMLGQNSSGESGELYHPRVRSTMFSNRDQQHHVLPLSMSTPERTRRSNAPRSPKGARAFTIVPESDGTQALAKTPVNHSASYPGQPTQSAPSVEAHSPQRVRAPRSPKGAKRMLITQPESSRPNKTSSGARVLVDQYPSMNSSTHPVIVPYNQHNSARSPERLPRGVSNYQRQPSSNGVAMTKTPDRIHRNNPHLQMAYSPRVQTSVRSPERQQKGVRNYIREGTSIQQRQYIQQQQQNRSRWDKWAAEQEEKRRQTNYALSTGDSSSIKSGAGLQRNHSFTPSYGSGAAKSSQSSYSPKHRAEKTKSYPLQQDRFSGVVQTNSDEFDHLSPMSVTLDGYPTSQHENLTDGSSSLPEGASIAPQYYPRAPQGARGSGPKMAWSPPHKDRIKKSPQRSVQSMVGVSLLPKESIDIGPLSSSCRIPRVPVARARGQSDTKPLRMSQKFNDRSSGSFYVPTNSTHQSVV